MSSILNNQAGIHSQGRAGGSESPNLHQTVSGRCRLQPVTRNASTKIHEVTGASSSQIWGYRHLSAATHLRSYPLTAPITLRKSASSPPSMSWGTFPLTAVSCGLFCLDTKRLVSLDCSHPKGSSYHITSQ